MNPLRQKPLRSSRTGLKWHAIVFILLSVIFLWGSLSYFLQQTSYFYAIKVDGLEIGILSKEETLKELLHDLKQEASTYYGKEVEIVEEIDSEKVSRPLEEEEPQKVFMKLRHLLSYKVEARMVTVEGKDVLPVSSKKEVNNIIDLVKGAYFPEKENVSLEKVQMDENISSRSHYTYPEEIHDKEAVASILLNGTDRKETYLVSRGDSLWEIAENSNISVDELKDANPQLNGEYIREGEELNLIVPEPMVNVATVERKVVEENIPYETVYKDDSSMWESETKVVEEGNLGTKEIVYQVTRENGVEISREKHSETVVKEPEPEVIARGTAIAPSKGSGSFIWPVQGGDQITSHYGWRSGSFHAGIDIGASAGTSVLAADSGVVIFAGWDGGYGRSIVISHGQYYTRYAHNSQNLVSTGQEVNRGQVIAHVGSTGRSTGSHLHFEIRTGGKYGKTYNPLDFYTP